jgi:hypothetical protein
LSEREAGSCGLKKGNARLYRFGNGSNWIVISAIVLTVEKESISLSTQNRPYHVGDLNRSFSSRRTPSSFHLNHPDPYLPKTGIK